jgi:serine/threonine protein kinase
MDPQPPQTEGTSAAASAPKLVPFGKYLLLERVAVGGMAEVWLAKRMEGDGVSELLAVKRILPNLSADAEFIKMFVDEARIAGQLQHPGIVPMQELGRIGQTFYIAMEYVWGRDLLQILRTVKQDGQKIPFAAATYVAARVCEALHYAHVKVDKHGKPLELVHRDVSPQNVIVSFDGKVKLIDFGIAKAASRTTKTQAGTLKGKVGYMSPEQVRGLPVDGRSDLFAVGTLLYEMLTVRPLFARGNNFEAMNRVRDADVPPIASRVPDIPPALAQIVTKALSREPGDRYATAQDMQKALTVFLAQHVSSFERFDLATWLRRVYDDEFTREKARLDALDSVGRPAISPVAKKHANPITSLEIATTSLFDAADDEDATQVADHAPYHAIKLLDGPSEVFFHRDEVVQVGEGNPEGHAARPLKALFRPGKPDAVEAYRPPLVGRDDRPASSPPVTRAVVAALTSVPVGGANHPSSSPSSTASSAVPSSAPSAGAASAAPSAGARAPSIPPPRAAMSARPAGRGTPAPGEASAIPPATERTKPDAAARPRPSPLLKKGLPTGTHPYGIDATSARVASPTQTIEDDPPSRATLPHHAPASSRPPTAAASVDAIPIEISAPFEQVSSVEVSAELSPVVMKGPTLVKRQVDEDDETFDDGGIREPLVRPVVSRARIVSVSDLPPPQAPAPIVPPGAPLPDSPTQPGRPGLVPLIGAGDTPSTSAITRALEQMAREQNTRSSSSGSMEAVTTDPGRVSGFALDPQQLDSQIIRQILPVSSSGQEAAPKGEPTESFQNAQRAGRVGHVPTLLPRATAADYLFFALAALLTVALGSTAAVAVLFADSAAALEVHCVPAVEATVIVDGLPRGRAPVRLDDLAPGQHTITIVAPGFVEAQRQVVIAPRESASIEVALTTTPERTRDAPLPQGVLPPGAVTP